MDTRDVVVVGAGIVGASIAARLAERDYSVVIVEREGVGAGASGRNAGSIIFPPDPYYIPLYDETLDLYAELAESGGRFPGVTQSGVLAVGKDSSVLTRLTEYLQDNRPELEAEYLEPGAAAQLEPELGPDVGACRSPAAYTIDPALATLALVEKAQASGAVLHIGFNAELWVEDGQLLGVRDGETKIAADQVVVCAGVGTTAILRPIEGSIVVSPLWGVIADLSLPRPPTHILLEAESQLSLVDETYPAPPPDVEAGTEIGFGFITVGDISGLGHSMSEQFPDRNAVISRFIRLGSSYLPGLADARIRTTRVAARPSVADDKPVLGRLGRFPNCILATGHGGRGVTIGPATARLVTDLIEGKGEVPAEMSADRFS